MGSNMFARLLLLFVAIPIIEFILLLEVGKEIGALVTVGLVVFTGIIGAYLAKREGIQIFLKIRSTLSRGEIPGLEMVEGVMILIGGALLLTPGFITDLAGFSLLVPQLRSHLVKRLIRYFTRKFQDNYPAYH